MRHWQPTPENVHASSVQTQEDPGQPVTWWCHDWWRHCRWTTSARRQSAAITGSWWRRWVTSCAPGGASTTRTTTTRKGGAWLRRGDMQRGFCSLNKSRRQRELLRITHENQAILKRILAKEPQYNHMEWLEQWKVGGGGGGSTAEGVASGTGEGVGQIFHEQFKVGRRQRSGGAGDRLPRG